MIGRSFRKVFVRVMLSELLERVVTGYVQNSD